MKNDFIKTEKTIFASIFLGLSVAQWLERALSDPLPPARSRSRLGNYFAITYQLSNADATKSPA